MAGNRDEMKNILNPYEILSVWILVRNTDIVMVKPTEAPLRVIRPRYYSNNNLHAQKGVLTFWESTYPGLPEAGEKSDLTETDRKPLDVRLDECLQGIKALQEIYLYRILIPQDTAAGLYSHIDSLGYNASTIFPGYDGVAKYMDERDIILNCKQNNG